MKKIICLISEQEITKKWSKWYGKWIFFQFGMKLWSFIIFLMQKTSACPSLVVTCPKFDLAHSKAHCKGRKGDFLSLGNQRFEAILITPVCRLTVICGFPRFCRNSGPNNFNFSGNRLTVTFRSNSSVEGEGAECTIACSDLAPAANTSPGICAVLEPSLQF